MKTLGGETSVTFSSPRHFEPFWQCVKNSLCCVRFLLIAGIAPLKVGNHWSPHPPPRQAWGGATNVVARASPPRRWLCLPFPHSRGRARPLRPCPAPPLGPRSALTLAGRQVDGPRRRPQVRPRRGGGRGSAWRWRRRPASPHPPCPSVDARAGRRGGGCAPGAPAPPPWPPPPRVPRASPTPARRPSAQRRRAPVPSRAVAESPSPCRPRRARRAGASLRAWAVAGRAPPPPLPRVG